MRYGATVFMTAMLAAASPATLAAPASDLKIVIKQQSQEIETVRIRSDNPWIDLGEGQHAVITENGVTEILRGPFHGRLKEARETIALRKKNTETAKVRAAVPTGMFVPENVTAADLSFDGGETQCLTGTPRHLWRAEASAPLTLLISLVGGPSRTVSFSGGQSVIDWPKDLALKADGEYVLSQPDSDVPTRKFRLVAAKSDTADKLADEGCVHQAKVAAELKSRSGQ